ncbi:MAG: hypothetical protein WDO73_03900 [Ignavibacteriota bacterium]
MEESLEELAELAASAGAQVVSRVTQTRPGPEAATLIGPRQSGRTTRPGALRPRRRPDLRPRSHAHPAAQSGEGGRL